MGYEEFVYYPKAMPWVEIDCPFRTGCFVAGLRGEPDCPFRTGCFAAVLRLESDCPSRTNNEWAMGEIH